MEEDNVNKGNKVIFTRFTEGSEDGDSVQATPGEWPADHLPSLLPPAAAVLCHHLLQAHLLWGGGHRQPVHTAGHHHAVCQVRKYDNRKSIKSIVKLFSVMGKLPATSYVRMVDIWLIFGQLYPFIQGQNVSTRKLNVSADAKLFLSQVVLLTIIEMHVFEEYTNSHGFRRFAPESNKKTEEDTLVWHLTVVLAHLLLLFQNQQTKIGKWILPEIPSVHKIAKTCGMYGM